MRRLFITLWILLLASGQVMAQSSATEPVNTGTSSYATDGPSGGLPFPVGIRLGYTSWDHYSQISQMHFGAHAKLGDLFPNVQFTPSVEAGFGENNTVVTINGDFSYRFTEFVSYPWEFNGGGCLSLNYHDLQDHPSDFQLGLSLLAGLSKALPEGDEVMVEVRFGILDSPDFKLTFGYTFF